MLYNQIINDLKKILNSPDLQSKEWIYQQYDSQVMGDTLEIAGNAAIVRIHGTNKALSITSDCTPRYVKADPFIGGMQAVCETYRNISSTGAKPMAITNCLNFGNPEKPEIMGQIVKAIKGINEACKYLKYPVVSGNVSLYNETNGTAINPSPTIGGVGLLKDLTKRTNIFFKNNGDAVFLLGNISGHIDCSIYQRDILQIRKETNPPKIDLIKEKNNSEFIQKLVSENKINSCHDISDGGLLVAIFEMSKNFGFEFNINFLDKNPNISNIMFGEDQGNYLFSCSQDKIAEIQKLAQKNEAELTKIGHTINAKLLKLSTESIEIKELKNINSQLKF